MFQEGHDAVAEQAFREIARLTGGAWCRFDPGAAAQLRELLRAAAAYAAGGREALLRLSKTGKRRGQIARPDEVIPASGSRFIVSSGQQLLLSVIKPGVVTRNPRWLLRLRNRNASV